MATTITTVSVHAEEAERLRQFRDERGHPSMNAALAELLNRQED